MHGAGYFVRVDGHSYNRFGSIVYNIRFVYDVCFGVDISESRLKYGYVGAMESILRKNRGMLRQEHVVVRAFSGEDVSS